MIKLNEKIQRKIFQYFQKNKIENFVGVPDSTLKHFIDEGLKHKKILITPHNSSATPADSVAPQILENYRRATSGCQLLNLVDLEHGY